jgi:capsule polysaccharide export protein KpsE/RkpR
MPACGGLVIDPPPENVMVVGVTVVAFTAVALTVVILPVVAVKVVNAPVFGAVLPIGVGELRAKANPAESSGALMLSTVYSKTSADVYTLNLYDPVPNQMLA